MAIDPPNEESAVTEMAIGNTTPLPDTDDPLEKRGHKTRMCPHQIAKSLLQKRVNRRLELMPRNRNTTCVLINPSYVLETIGNTCRHAICWVRVTHEDSIAFSSSAADGSWAARWLTIGV